MIESYKIKIIEGEKTVKQEIELIGNNKEEVLKEIKSVYEELQPFIKTKTLQKNI